MSLPDWIDPECWSDWLEMRVDKKYPVTERQQKSALRVLRRAFDDGHDPNKMLDNAIQGSWQGLFTGENTLRKIRPASHNHGTKIVAIQIDKEQARSALQAARGKLG